MKAFFFMVTFAILLLACNSTTNPPQKQAPTSAKAASIPKEKIKNEPITFPIYTSFDQIAPIFKYENDTTYVINFWATWCKPCVEELPYFEQLHEQYHDQKVKVILVSLDFAKQIQAKLIPFVEKNKLQSEVIAMVDSDYNSWIDKVNPDWDGAIPVTMIYNKHDRQFVSEQFESYADLESIFQEVFVKN